MHRTCPTPSGASSAPASLPWPPCLRAWRPSRACCSGEASRPRGVPASTSSYPWRSWVSHTGGCHCVHGLSLQDHDQGIITRLSRGPPCRLPARRLHAVCAGVCAGQLWGCACNSRAVIRVSFRAPAGSCLQQGLMPQPLPDAHMCLAFALQGGGNLGEQHRPAAGGAAGRWLPLCCAVALAGPVGCTQVGGVELLEPLLLLLLLLLLLGNLRRAINWNASGPPAGGRCAGRSASTCLCCAC